MRRFSAVVIVWAAMQGIAFGDILVSIEDVNVVAGDVATVGIFVAGTEEEVIDSFDFPIEVGGDGRGFPSGLNGNFEVVAVNSFTDDIVANDATLPNPPFVQNYEVIFSDSGTGITLTNSPLRLFNLQFETLPTASGSISLDVAVSGSTVEPFQLESNGTSLSSQDVQDGNGVFVSSGSINFVSVPEPSTSVILGLLAMHLSTRRRRRIA